MTAAVLALLLALAVGLLLPGPAPLPPRTCHPHGRRQEAAGRGNTVRTAVRVAVPGRRRVGGERLDEHTVALAADLVVAVVEAGVPLPAAVEAVAAQLPGLVGDGLHAAARLLAVGAAPSAALAPLLAEPAAAPVARALRAALESGASPVPLLEAAAGSQRERARSARLRRARGLGSRAALPLSLCFLPAFVLVGVVPVVVGGLSTVLTGG